MKNPVNDYSVEAWPKTKDLRLRHVGRGGWRGSRSVAIRPPKRGYFTSKLLPEDVGIRPPHRYMGFRLARTKKNEESSN